ncbi:hypothetical protein HUK80_06380 [Flavobacterium sp. MAH-1]|uniref:Uncharacterized protein n=1 Tax=Flavobacterium agri TaxID=2743471 RepID=A0A7Y8Y174_9FLAO|nr:hypothetical protein [Flavobacterium agri]NUY80515.1 hypothetical protein [Flavobacterium agri]NYA70540.1 hypothetical protein [Flavobacterium agri]
MKKALTLLVLLVSLCLQAQSHNYKNCKLARKILISEVNICPACSKKMQKEEKARQAERKRVSDVNLARRKAEAAARDKAASEELARIRANQTSTEVVINAQPSTPTAAAPTQNTAESQGYMSGNYAEFYDSDTRKPIPRPENGNNRLIASTGGALKFTEDKTARYAFPKNTGIISYANNPVRYCNGYNYVNADLVDYRYNTLLNDPDVYTIFHLYGDYFFITYKKCEDYERPLSFRTDFTTFKIYNRATGKFWDPKIEGSVNMSLNTMDYDGLHHKFKGYNTYYMFNEFKPEGKHGSFELLFDELSGGTDGWKAATPVRIHRSSDKNDTYLFIVMIAKDNSIKTYTVTSAQYDPYFDKPAE